MHEEGNLFWILNSNGYKVSITIFVLIQWITILILANYLYYDPYSKSEQTWTHY